MRKKSLEKAKIIKRVKGVNYISQSKYSRLYGHSPADISYYVIQGKIEVIPVKVKDSVHYYIDENYPCPENLKSGRPKGS